MKRFHPLPSSGPSGRMLARLAAVGALLFLASCAQSPIVGQQWDATPKPPPKPAAQAKAEKASASKKTKAALWEWNGDGRRVTHIVVDTKHQKARFYDGEEQIGWSYIASGRRAYRTPTGQFQIMEKTTKKRSNLYGRIYDAKGRLVKRNARYGRDPIPKGGRFVGAKMPYFMRLTYDGIGFHAGRIPKPGSPASHGCIRMPKEMAPILYRHVSIGTPVTIVGPGPSYGNYARKQREARAARLAAKARAERLKKKQEVAQTAAPVAPPAEPQNRAVEPVPEQAPAPESTPERVSEVTTYPIQATPIPPDIQGTPGTPTPSAPVPESHSIPVPLLQTPDSMTAIDSGTALRSPGGGGTWSVPSPVPSTEAVYHSPPRIDSIPTTYAKEPL